MEIKEIIPIVEKVTGFSLDEMKAARGGDALRARYALIGVLVFDKENRRRYVSRMLGIKRPTVYTNVNSFQIKVLTDRELKKMYRRCRNRIREIEQGVAA